VGRLPGETARTAENTRKAYDLREREKFYIASHYEMLVSRDLEATRKIYELWPRPIHATPPNNLGFIYQRTGGIRQNPRCLSGRVETRSR
jgi:hypothetical protein